MMKKKYSILKIEKIKPDPTEVITLFYDNKLSKPNELKIVMEILKNKFPDNKIIALPNNMNLETCSKDVLENIISLITEIIEGL